MRKQDKDERKSLQIIYLMKNLVFRIYKENSKLSFLIKLENDTTPLENKVKQIPTILFSQFTPKNLPKRNKSIHPYKDLYINVYQIYL